MHEVHYGSGYEQEQRDCRQTVQQTDAEREADRLARRANIRQGIARRQLLQDQAQAVAAEMRRLEQQIHSATDEHTATCGPLQEELRALEAKAVKRIEQRKPTNAEEDQRRQELLQAIEAENTRLSQLVKTIRQETPKLQERLRDLNKEVAHQPTQSDLAREGVANPQLLLQAHSAFCRVKWAEARSRDAEAKLAAARKVDETSGTHRAPKWEVEAEAAGRELIAANQANSEIYQQLLDE